MGQRHQLFIIAKFGSRYRGLAALHHQWLYGAPALRICNNLLTILSDKTNRDALHHELRLADDFFKTDPLPETPLSPFPFISSCLIAGTSTNPSSATRAAMVHDLPYDLVCWGGDNNDGITVIDLTDLDNIRFCYVRLYAHFTIEDDDFDEEEDFMATYVPLTGRQYLRGYYRPNMTMWEETQDVVRALDKYELIDVHTLDSAWPKAEWKADESEPVTPERHPSYLAVPETNSRDLVQQSFAKVVDTALATPGFDMTVVEETINTLDHRRALLIQELIKNAAAIGPSESTAPLLKLAYKGQKSLDWTVYKNLDPQSLASSLAGDELSAAESIVLPLSALPESTAEALVLAQALGGRDFDSVLLPEYPGRKDDDKSVRTFLAAAISDSRLARTKCILPGLSSRAIKQETWLPAGDIPSFVESFPVVQMLVSRQYEDGRPTKDDGDFDFGPPAREVIFLGDGLLGPERCVTGMLRYLAAVCIPDGYGSNSCLDAVCAIATAPSTLEQDRVDSMEMSILPAEAWTTGHLGKSFSMGGSCKIRKLLPGQYSIIVQIDEEKEKVMMLNERFPKLQPATFRYCFVCPKTEILVGKTATVEPYGAEAVASEALAVVPTVVDPEMVEVMDATTFLSRTAPWLGRVELDAHVQRLHLTATLLSETGLAPDNILSVMGSDEACRLLGKFVTDSYKTKPNPYQRFALKKDAPSGESWKAFFGIA